MKMKLLYEPSAIEGYDNGIEYDIFVKTDKKKTLIVNEERTGASDYEGIDIDTEDEIKTIFPNLSYLDMKVIKDAVKNNKNKIKLSKHALSQEKKYKISKAVGLHSRLNWSTLYGHLEDAPSLLRDDDALTRRVHRIVEDAFSFDVCRVGSLQGIWGDQIHYIDTENAVAMIVHISSENNKDGTVTISLRDISWETDAMAVYGNHSFSFSEIQDENISEEDEYIILDAVYDALESLKKNIR